KRPVRVLLDRASCRSAPATPSSSRSAARTRPASGSRPRLASIRASRSPFQATLGGMAEPQVILATGIPDSPARTRPPEREPFRIGAVQERWHADPDEHRAALATGVRLAAEAGARLVCLQELTLSRYFAVEPGGPAAVGAEPEELPGGPTHRLA